MGKCASGHTPVPTALNHITKKSLSPSPAVQRPTATGGPRGGEGGEEGRGRTEERRGDGGTGGREQGQPQEQQQADAPVQVPGEEALKEEAEQEGPRVSEGDRGDKQARGRMSGSEEAGRGAGDQGRGQGKHQQGARQAVKEREDVAFARGCDTGAGQGTVLL